MNSPSARVTAVLANASDLPSISATYQQTSIYYKPVTIEVALDEKGCLDVELPLTEAKMVEAGPQNEVRLFLEPGDQLHVEADLLDLPGSLHFSGRGADNNQFLADLRARFPDYLRIDYRDLEVDAFRKMVDQRRLEMERFVDEGCRQYQLTGKFIAYWRAEITYEWAEGLASYPVNYQMQNGRENEALPADYYDALDPVELVDETAIGTPHYRTFLERHFDRLDFEAFERVDWEQLSEDQRQDLDETWSSYNQARRALQGRVLYFFLAGEIIADLQDGRFDQGERRRAEFIRGNPHPEYTQAVEEMVRETASLKPGQLHPRRCRGPERLPERFQRPGGFFGLLVQLVRPLYRCCTPSGKDQTADQGSEGRLPEYLPGPECR